MELCKKEKVYIDDEEINVLYLLNEYADANPEFISTFLDSCDKMFDQNGFLSGRQINILNGIYEKLD